MFQTLKPGHLLLVVGMVGLFVVGVGALALGLHLREVARPPTTQRSPATMEELASAPIDDEDGWVRVDPSKLKLEIKNPDLRLDAWQARIDSINRTLACPAGIAKAELDSLQAEKETLEGKRKRLPLLRVGSWEEILRGDDPNRDDPLDPVGLPGPNNPYKQNGMFPYKGYKGWQNAGGYEKTTDLWYNKAFSRPAQDLYWFRARMIFESNGVP